MKVRGLIDLSVSLIQNLWKLLWIKIKSLAYTNYQFPIIESKPVLPA